MAHEPPATQGGRPQGQLERTMVDITIGTIKSMRTRERNLAATRAGEWDQQVEFPISGLAGNEWGSVDVPVTWEHPFIYAPTQRSVPFPNPHVADHVEWQALQGGALVISSLHIIAWNVNDYGWWIGATVRVAVCAPNATAAVAYQGVVHLTFEGYASPTDGDITT